jgi:hypothetical protein
VWGISGVVLARTSACRVAWSRNFQWGNGNWNRVTPRYSPIEPSSAAAQVT